MDKNQILFIHGSDSSSQTYKAQLLLKLFPDMVIPDFSGPLGIRMGQLDSILGNRTRWVLIGSSLGGLMATLFAAQNPKQVTRLVLLAPALTLPEFIQHLPKPIHIPTILIHGKNDDVVSPDKAYRVAKTIFTNLTYYLVDDDHRLHHTAETLDWLSILS